jgi:hypothetical protein
MTSSHAKQHFGELLDAVAQGPVAIERHRKIKAIVSSPDAFNGPAAAGQVLAGRQAARAAQALVDKDRLIKHQRLAIELLVMPEAERTALIARARGEVAKWRRDRLCSADYADRWDELLALPIADLARRMCSDLMGWGVALRQNSPWHVVLP